MNSRVKCEAVCVKAKAKWTPDRATGRQSQAQLQMYNRMNKKKKKEKIKLFQWLSQSVHLWWGLTITMQKQMPEILDELK